MRSGSKKPKNLDLQGLNVPLGIKVDHRGNLVVADAGCACIQIYARGATMPSRTLTGFQQPSELAFDKKESLLSVSDAQAADVVVLAYETGTVQSTISAGLSASNYPWGVALNPAAPL